MHILFYYPSNKRTISIETLIRKLIQRKHTVSLLTLCERGDLHDELEKMGVNTFTNVLPKTNPVQYLITQIFYLVGFCKENQVDSVFSHLQQANIIAVFARYFTKAKIIIFRHHDYARNKSESRADKIINRLASVIVVPSSGVQGLMLKNERINPQKIKLIPYIYDFNDYKKPDKAQVEAIRQKYSCRLLLIMVSRLVPQKRHDLVFTVVTQLIKDGLDIKLLVMDTGSEQKKLKAYISDNQLENRIFLVGFQTNIIDFIEASDVMVHPSLSEASCSAIKEAGLLEKIVIVCKGIGDFDDYIIDGENGFAIDVNQSQKQLLSILNEIHGNKEAYYSFGKRLKLSVVDRFSASEKVMEQYDLLLNNA